MIALAAHFVSMARGGRSYYTAPLKALVSEKFFDLVVLFGTDNVGMITGNVALNPLGDESKGKVVDVLTPSYDVVARFQGGPNAGHTLEFEGKKYILRSIPSGIFQGGKINIIGNGVVLDPLLFREEAEALAASGYDR